MGDFIDENSKANRVSNVFGLICIFAENLTKTNSCFSVCIFNLMEDFDDDFVIGLENELNH